MGRHGYINVAQDVGKFQAFVKTVKKLRISCSVCDL